VWPQGESKEDMKRAAHGEHKLEGFGFIKALSNLSCIYVAMLGKHGRGKLLPKYLLLEEVWVSVSRH